MKSLIVRSIALSLALTIGLTAAWAAGTPKSMNGNQTIGNATCYPCDTATRSVKCGSRNGEPCNDY
jgi:hypothetical protein